MFALAPSSKSSESRVGINLNTDRLTRGNRQRMDGRTGDRPHEGGAGGRQNALFNVIDVFVSFTFWHLHANPFIRARTSAASPAAGLRSVGRGGRERRRYS